MLVALSKRKIYKKLSKEQKGYLLDMLVKLEELGGGFFLDKKFKTPLTDVQIAAILGMAEDKWLLMRDCLVKGKILKEHNGGVYCPLMSDQVELHIPEEDIKIAEDILAFWNEHQIVVHKQTPALISRIVRLIRKFDHKPDQVKESIGNYAAVMRSELHFWNYKWNLDEFLSRGVARFANSMSPLEKYKKKDSRKVAGPSIMTPAVKEINPEKFL